ncbi:MAG TPA: SDR family NAD(P)-dependent oxidoreductase, partial [Longimicrobiales bacterium]
MPADHQHAYAGRRVAVLGASGFIGRRVAAALARQGAELYLLARVTQAAEALAGELGGDPSVLRCDVALPGELERAIEKVRPAIVFNLAGYGVDPAERDESLASLINAELPRRLCRALADWRDGGWPGQAVLHVGSALEYGRATGDLREYTEPLPDTL